MLTETAIRNLRPQPPKVKKLFDGDRSGLHVICHPGRRKSFAIKYAHPGTSKEQTLTIGQYPYANAPSRPVRCWPKV